MKKLNLTLINATLSVAALFCVTSANAGFILQNGGGNGSVNIEVDGYGAFGEGLSNLSPDSPGAATFQTTSGNSASTGPASATFIRVGGGQRTLLTTSNVFGLGNQPVVSIINDNGAAVSSFTVETAGQPTLGFGLRQSLQPLFSGTTRSGTVLLQEYTITNQSATTAAAFDAVRYFDASLAFDGTANDGGGLINLQGDEFVFVTDRNDAQLGNAATTFVGLEADNPGANGFIAGRYTIGEDGGSVPFPQRLFFLTANGAALNNMIIDDSDVNNFVDDSSTTNLALAYSSDYLLNPLATTTFLSRTIFGSGAPADVTPVPPTVVPDPTPVPTPISLLLVASGLLSMRRKPR